MENPQRHLGVDWAQVAARLEAKPKKLWSLGEMERTDGEPDVVGCEAGTGEFIFTDCAAESPVGRQSVSYDQAVRESRKEHAPATSAVEMAEAMGVALSSEAEYRALQALVECDRKSSSWLNTPAEMRKLGGALFGDKRFGRVFLYYNGAQSYCSGRGFRAELRV